MKQKETDYQNDIYVLTKNTKSNHYRKRETFHEPLPSKKKSNPTIASFVSYSGLDRSVVYFLFLVFEIVYAISLRA